MGGSSSLLEIARKVMRTITVPVEGLNFAGCAQSIEKRLGILPSVARVDANYVTQTVTLQYDDQRLYEGDLRALLRDCGFACGAPMDTLAAVAAARERPAAAPGLPVPPQPAT